MTTLRLALLVLCPLALGAAAQAPGDLLARLEDPSESERSAALTALAKLPSPEMALLDPIAASLLDEAESVRVAAAYALASVVGKLGCRVETLEDCKLFATILDATPKKVKSTAVVYPDEAKRARVQGTVRLECLIGAEGSVDRVRILDGPLQLHNAAAVAVRQWKYRPAMRDGQAVPFAMIIWVSFRLS